MERDQTILFEDDTILYMKPPKDSTKKVLRADKLRIVADYKSNIPKSVAFLPYQWQTHKEINRGNSSIHNYLQKLYGINPAKEVKNKKL